jgi:hypothetical protein
LSTWAEGANRARSPTACRASPTTDHSRPCWVLSAPESGRFGTAQVLNRPGNPRVAPETITPGEWSLVVALQRQLTTHRARHPWRGPAQGGAEVSACFWLVKACSATPARNRACFQRGRPVRDVLAHVRPFFTRNRSHSIGASCFGAEEWSLWYRTGAQLTRQLPGCIRNDHAGRVVTCRCSTTTTDHAPRPAPILRDGEVPSRGCGATLDQQ